MWPFSYTSRIQAALVLFLLLVSGSRGFVVSSPLSPSSSSSASFVVKHGSGPHPHAQSHKNNNNQQMQHQAQPTCTTEKPVTLEEQDQDIDEAESAESNMQSEKKAKRQIVISSELELPFSPEVAFDAFSNLTRQPSWSPWLRSVEYTSPTETVWKMRRILGLSYSWTATTAQLQRPHVMAWESTQGLKNFGRVEFVSANSTTNNDNQKESSLIRLQLTVVVPRVLSRLMGENSRVQRFVQGRMVRSSLRQFRNVVMEQQGIDPSHVQEEDDEDEQHADKEDYFEVERE